MPENLIKAGGFREKFLPVKDQVIIVEIGKVVAQRGRVKRHRDHRDECGMQPKFRLHHGAPVFLTFSQT